ncbi:hypothetical protein MNBD_UNCLBAC01-1343 [hydrothermal vent metagenome]|uniref:Sodium/calcium exchanger membrane region domain-containing protein n=1 Tax=hydrothermal vent metagenome TaxID=652676 RepID=A0A3B1E5D6_9ZZZZ
MIWLKFLISAAIIVWAGIRLTYYVDQLSDRLQLGKVWLGVVLLGFITSLPEVISSLSAVIFLNADDLALGNLLGSNNFNPMLLVVMDVVYRKGSITNAIVPHRSYRAAAGFAVVLTVIVMAGLWLPLGRISSFIIAGVYFCGMRYLACLEKEPSTETKKDESVIQRSLSGIVGNIVFSSILVIGAAIWLAGLADNLAAQTGLGRTFFGSIFLALVTSLPEMVVSLSALKLGAFDLAVGNIFGSNMTNIFIVSLCEVFHKGGAFLSGVSQTHILTATLSIVLTCVAVAGIELKNKKSFLGVGLDSFIMILLFLIGTQILYQLR